MFYRILEPINISFFYNYLKIDLKLLGLVWK